MRSPARLRRALVRGKPATHWLYRQGQFVVRGSLRGQEIAIPSADVNNPMAMEAHRRRLLTTKWVHPGAIDELIAMANAVRT